MEEPNNNETRKNKITLLGFFYTLCVISIISLVCLVYVLHLRNKATEERINKLETSINAIQNENVIVDDNKDENTTTNTDTSAEDNTTNSL